MVTSYDNHEVKGVCRKCKREVPVLRLKETGRREDPHYLCPECWEERRQRLAALIPARSER